MKPTNVNDNGCDPISSSCVIWQGPELTCINLCKGDSVSVVVEKLATKLCTLMDTFNIDNYDISCFNLAECTPKDFQALINLLIEKICADQGLASETVAGGCPDCVVNTCSEFHYVNPTGDTVTTMQLLDYVLAIGNKVCSLVGQINTINATLVNHNTRITTLEDAGQQVIPLPLITPTCVLPQTPTALDLVLVALEQEFCALQTATGDPTAISQALQAACTGLNASNQLSGLGTMQQITGWHATPVNMSESFGNLWRAVCDIRTAITGIQATCCDTGCNAINLLVGALLNSPTELQLEFTGSIPATFSDNSPNSTIEITEVSGSGSQLVGSINIKSAHFDPVTPLIIPLTSVNGANDILVKTTYRFIDITGSTCENIVVTVALGTDTCPDLILTPSYLQAGWSFAWNGTIGSSVTMELWDVTETIPISSTSFTIASSNPSGSFTGLDEGVTYKIRLVIGAVACEFESFITLTYPCNAPSVNAPTINYALPVGDVNGKTMEAWQLAYNAGTHPDLP